MHNTQGAAGAPPRARGGRSANLLDEIDDRSTPASAGRTRTADAGAFDVEEHPRERGEDLPSTDLAGASVGAPPRARGGPSSLSRSAGRQRSTPASAGRTPDTRCRTGRLGEHPRERGEDARNPAADGLSSGAPLRARGGRGLDVRDTVDDRSTPASAGRTYKPSPRHAPTWEHPRERGEDMESETAAIGHRGAPPRARGGRQPGVVRGGRRRSTPASAGRTIHVLATSPRVWEHPRERGEDTPSQSKALHASGAPPRARGGLRQRRHVTRGAGSTPASAGRTSQSPPRRGAITEHPRERGEDGNQASFVEAADGAPPRARGGRYTSWRHPLASGSTPASAGRTPHLRARHSTHPEHPRERGEDFDNAAMSREEQGAPPRARGGRRSLLLDVEPLRSTPASAGRTRLRRVGHARHGEHPRERGEDTGCGSARRGSRGAPPRARGGRQLRDGHPAAAGSTPASAGRTPDGAPRRRRCTEHPRERGEDSVSINGSPAISGAPPRARGGRAHR